MTSLTPNIFSSSEREELKKILKNPEEDLQRLTSLLEKKVQNGSKQSLELEDNNQSIVDGLTHAGIGVDIVNKDYEVLFQNQVLKERFGDCIKKNCYRSYMSFEKPCDFCPMEEALKFNKVEHIELEAADGRSYELISTPYPNRDGTIDKVAEVVIDITDRKKIEQKLRESEEKYRILTEQSLMGIFIIQEGKFKYINQVVSDINGYTVEEMLNWSQGDMVKTIYSEDLENIMINLRRSEQGDLDDVSSSIFRLITKS
ncbi:MAG: PAS domain-containing protein, partial [Promethearchaeota archaeon]